MAEDAQIAQDSSIHRPTPQTLHLEDPVGPRRTHRARPLANLDRVSAGKDSYHVWT